MIAIKIYKTGGPEVLKIEKINLGKPGPNEVLIKHVAIGLNFIDTYHRSGLYPLPHNPPICPGLEASGEIIGLGKDVRNLDIGDKLVIYVKKGVDVFKNGTSTALIVICGLDVLSTYHSLMPKDESNLRINLFFFFGS